MKSVLQAAICFCVKELKRQAKDVAHHGSHAGPVATSNSASHEVTGHLAQRHIQTPSIAALPGVPGAQWPQNYRGETASISFLAPSVLLLTDLPWTEVAVDFSSYSFLRLRCRDKVLGGKPNSRLQGCHFLTLTETNPETEEGREEGKTQRAYGSRSHRL